MGIQVPINFITLGSGIDHIESRSLPGVSDGEPSPSAARDFAPGGFALRRLEPPGIAGDAERERVPTFLNVW